MKFILIVCIFLIHTTSGFCQGNLVPSFVSDTMTLPETGKVLEGEYLETTFKNLSVARLFKTPQDKYYLRLLVTKNFYFDKVAVLEIQSGTKSYYAKNTRQFKVSKTQGLFVIEIFRNYIVTLKDFGITGIVFGEAQTDFTKQDAAQVKKMAEVFYGSITAKK